MQGLRKEPAERALEQFTTAFVPQNAQKVWNYLPQLAELPKVYLEQLRAVGQGFNEEMEVSL
ncbi:MAG: hypothetical protein ACFCA4_10085 [Cyanophyceae cyanobacterium]